MKRCLFTLLLSCTLWCSVQAQTTYTVDGENLDLKTEVEGPLNLLWTSKDQVFRYFIADKNGTITELKNTKVDGKFQSEYITQLENLTNNGVTALKVKFILPDLKRYIVDYNNSVAPGTNTYSRMKLKTRLGAFGGLTNSPFAENPENETTGLFGAELEFFGDTKTPRHAGFLSARHSLSNDKFKYSATQIALGYRFRFIKNEAFNFYANVKFATLTFVKDEVTTFNPANPLTTIVVEESATLFDTPFIFGVGADIKLGNGYVTLAYNELFAILLDNQGNFPIDFALGYKFNL